MKLTYFAEKDRVAFNNSPYLHFTVVWTNFFLGLLFKLFLLTPFYS